MIGGCNYRQTCSPEGVLIVDCLLLLLLLLPVSTVSRLTLVQFQEGPGILGDVAVKTSTQTTI